MANAKELKALITLAGKIDPSLQSAMLKAQKQTKGTSGAMSLLQKAGSGAFSVIKTGAKAGALALGALALSGGAALISMGKIGLQTASDLAEVQNVVDVTFGDSAGRINSWSQSLLNSYGLAELSAKRYSSTMGAMLKSSGIANDDLLVMSQSLTMLTGDMASFYNLEPDAMFEKLQAGISGQTQPLKELGINMSVANLEAYALAQGIKKDFSAMNQAEQAALRYNYIMQATADSQGDFNRTSDSMANQQKLLKENFTQLASKVMTGVVPAISKLFKGLNDVMAGMDTDTLSGFVSQIADLAVGLMPIVMDLLPVAQKLLNTLLPPLLSLIKIVLPPITKFLSFVIDLIGKIINAGKNIWDGIVGLFSGGKSEKSSDASQVAVETFARGGFSSRPAIFGEAGLEAAIPIKKGSPRSLALLQRTAQLLGVGFGVGGGSSFTYAPVIHGGDPETLEPILRKHSEDIWAMLSRRENRRRRLNFAPVPA